jgi:epoxyqueuosine reductase
MVTSSKLKSVVKDKGADLCGIAPADRFKAAPKGFHPNDIYEKCKSELVFAKRLPTESLFASSCIPYTHINNIIIKEVDRLTIELSLELEDLGVKNVPIPSDDPYEHWIPSDSYGRAILSLRHAGHLAGLGVLGKSTLLINCDFGNMIQLGAILLDVELEGDTIASYIGCPSECSLCLEVCPQSALDGKTVDQKLCRPLSNYISEKGYNLKKCYLCRKICPNHSGLK